MTWHHPSVSQTTSWKPFSSLCTWAQQYPKVSPLRPRAIGAPGMEAATALSRLKKRVWSKSKLTKHTKVQVNKTWILRTRLYGSESWTLRSKQGNRMNSFHIRWLRCVLGIFWRDKTPNNTVLENAGITSMYTTLKQRAGITSMYNLLIG